MSADSSDHLEKAVSRAMAERVARFPDTSINSDGTTKSTLSQLSDERRQMTDIAIDTLEEIEIDLDALEGQNLVGHLYGSIESNVFSMLRTQTLQKMQKNDCHSLAILGPTEGVGKSFVTANLALSLAKQQALDVSLLDFDLRQPSIGKLFGVERKHSVADYLLDKCELRDIGFRTQIENLRIFAGQGSSESAAELLAGERAKSLLEDLASKPNSIVLVDLPPLCGIADVHTFLPNCDAALLVVEYAKTTKTELQESIRLIGTKPLVGSVVNKGRLSGDHAYGYGYGSRARV